MTKDDIEQILGACQRNNPEVHVTGMLLFTAANFLQLLEGPRSGVNERFQRISGDARHRDLEVIGAGPIDLRLFDGWSMQYIPQCDSMTSMLSRYAADGRFNPYEMSTSAVEHLCRDLSAETDLHASHAA
jgi:hypothetical protein